MIRLSKSDLADLRRRGLLPKGRKRQRSGEMNRNEQKYAEHLAIRQHAGEVVWFTFEGMKLRLADNTTFTPDFTVMLANGTLECHDAKGYKAKPSGEHGYWCEEDAKIKIKLAAEIWPFVFRIVYRTPAGEWLGEEV